MGINDRDYMRDKKSGPRTKKAVTAKKQETPILNGVIIALLIVLFLMLVKIPLPLPIKIAAMVGVLVAIYFRIFHNKEKLAIDHFKEGQDWEAKRDYAKAAKSYQKALADRPNSLKRKIRLLVCLDCSNQKQKAAEIAGKLDGAILSEQQVVETEVFVSKYRELQFTAAEGGQKLILGGEVEASD